MDVLGFVNSNGTLCTILGSIITALITSIVAIVIDNKKSKVESVRILKKELAETKQELNITQAELSKTQVLLSDAKSIEKAEENIDKSRGSIYYEKLSNGRTRTICGFCWEKEHIKIPIVAELCCSGYSQEYYYDGYCNSCKTRCIENVPDGDSSYDYEAADEGVLPF